MRWTTAVLMDLGGDLLRQPLRERLVALIRRQPGIHASEICRETGHAWATVHYHLRLLQDNAMIMSVEAGRERLFFAEAVDAQKVNLLSILRDGPRREIARLVQARPGLRQVDICRATALSRKTFRSNVNALIEAGLVAEEKGVQTNRYFPADSLGPLLEPVDVDVA